MINEHGIAIVNHSPVVKIHSMTLLSESISVCERENLSRSRQNDTYLDVVLMSGSSIELAEA